ncbi:MAG TPA: DUF1295 domain-containing protein, partial [Candidatus Saccharimonadales bacterium]|nr:DUF1295 domain-containing protein [Candidatus Saccharimonadales bacterium]
MWTIILISLGSSLLINIVLFLIAFSRKSDKLTDISYALSFLTIDLFSLIYVGKYSFTNLVLFALVAIWAVRIGGFLLYRVLKVGKDRRFDGIRESFTRFGKFWVGQAITAWVLMLPITLALYNGAKFKVLVFLGVVVWVVGLLAEAIADYQKFRFKQNKNNQGKWIQEGIWKLSRHPNYFGEITVWVGIYIACFSDLSTAEKMIGLASPLLISVVLLFISGVPLLEKSADERWGKDEAYKKYKQHTR